MFELEDVLPALSEDVDLEAVSCGTHKEGRDAQAKLAKTAGVLLACSSAGLIVHAAEIYGAESLSQRYFFISDLKTSLPELERVVHDDACHVHKFAARRVGDSDHAALLAPASYSVGGGIPMQGTLHCKSGQGELEE